MKIKKLNIKVFGLATFLLVPSLALAVSQKEMEQARTIAAKAYIRYVNDGSGYLDEVNPSTMEELEVVLKPKEQENLKAFKAIPVPSDYKDWNKDKLVEYWAVTAFQDPGLQEKGRGGRIRARNLINKMTIAPVSATEASHVKNSNLPEDITSEASDTTLNAPNIEQEDVDEAVNGEDLRPSEKAHSDTWVYIMILGILVALAIGLIVYAATVFRKKEPTMSFNRNDENDKTDQLESDLADKEVEISMLKKKLDSITRQNNELKSKLEALTIELASLKDAPQRISEPLKEKEIVETKPTPRASLRTIFLGRANGHGIFVRADRTLNPGHSVFVLDTSDGFSGSFRVADSAAAWELALSNPEVYLSTACTGYDLYDTSGVSKIITESSGTAVFEGGCWRVIRKAKIRYEH